MFSIGREKENIFVLFSFGREQENIFVLRGKENIFVLFSFGREENYFCRICLYCSASEERKENIFCIVQILEERRRKFLYCLALNERRSIFVLFSFEREEGEYFHPALEVRR